MPQIDVRRLAARRAASVLALQPPTTQRERGMGGVARQGRAHVVGEQMTELAKACCAQQPETARRGLRAGRRHHSLAGLLAAGGQPMRVCASRLEAAARAGHQSVTEKLLRAPAWSSVDAPLSSGGR